MLKCVINDNIFESVVRHYRKRELPPSLLALTAFVGAVLLVINKSLVHPARTQFGVDNIKLFLFSPSLTH